MTRLSAPRPRRRLFPRGIQLGKHLAERGAVGLGSGIADEHRDAPALALELGGEPAERIAVGTDEHDHRRGHGFRSTRCRSSSNTCDSADTFSMTGDSVTVAIGAGYGAPKAPSLQGW